MVLASRKRENVRLTVWYRTPLSLFVLVSLRLKTMVLLLLEECLWFEVMVLLREGR